jgi:hypothetical protein
MLSPWLLLSHAALAPSASRLRLMLLPDLCACGAAAAAQLLLLLRP